MNEFWVEKIVKNKILSLDIIHSGTVQVTFLIESVKIAYLTGQELRQNQNEEQNVITKEDGSPQANSDRRSDGFILEQLKKIDPRVPIISEESEIMAYSERKKWKKFWLVDSLDGTKEYLAGRSDYTVNIALIEENIPVLGVVYAPGMQKLYFAYQGLGSWCVEENDKILKRIHSRPPDLKSLLTIVESHSHPKPEMEEYLKNLKVKKRLKMGSSIKFCLLAEGKADIYPRFAPTMEWDVAAGDCIFRNSGKHGFRSSPLVYNKMDLKNGPFIMGVDPE